MGKFFLTRLKNGDFRTLFGQDREKARNIKPGRHIEVRYRTVRNPGHHRKYWALLQSISDNLDYSCPVDLIHKKLKVACGWFDIYEVNGKVITELKSMDYATMDREEFERYYEQAVNAAADMFGEWVLEIEHNTEHV